MVLMGLLVNQIQRLPYYEMLSRKYRFSLLIFSPGEIRWHKGTTKGLLLHRGAWYPGEYPLPAAVYNRCYPEDPEVIQRLEKALGSRRVFNTATLFDKLRVHELLAESEPLKPFLPWAKELVPGEGEILAEGKKWVIKPRRGQSGRGVYLLEPAGDFMLVTSGMNLPLPIPVDSLFPALVELIAAGEPYLIQEYVEGALFQGALFDVRVVVQKNRYGIWSTAGALSRVAAKGSFITNQYAGLYHPHEVLAVLGDAKATFARLDKLAKLAARRLDGPLGSLGEICVDFFLSSNGNPWIIEVNGKPDKGLFHELGDEGMLERVYLTPLTFLRTLSLMGSPRGKGVRG